MLSAYLIYSITSARSKALTLSFVFYLSPFVQVLSSSSLYYHLVCHLLALHRSLATLSNYSLTDTCTRLVYNTMLPFLWIVYGHACEDVYECNYGSWSHVTTLALSAICIVLGKPRNFNLSLSLFRKNYIFPAVILFDLFQNCIVVETVIFYILQCCKKSM